MVASYTHRKWTRSTPVNKIFLFMALEDSVHIKVYEFIEGIKGAQAAKAILKKRIRKSGFAQSPTATQTKGTDCRAQEQPHSDIIRQRLTQVPKAFNRKSTIFLTVMGKLNILCKRIETDPSVS